jgi:hypothetical protein
MRADTANSLYQNKRLYGVALGREFFYASVVVADKDFRVLDYLALGVELCMNGFLQ